KAPGWWLLPFHVARGLFLPCSRPDDLEQVAEQQHDHTQRQDKPAPSAAPPGITRGWIEPALDEAPPAATGQVLRQQEHPHRQRDLDTQCRYVGRTRLELQSVEGHDRARQ